MHKNWKNRFRAAKFGTSHRVTVFSIFVMSYVVMLIIPVIAGITAYYQMHKDTKNDILHTSEVQRIMVAEQLDTQLAAVESLMTRIAVGNQFEKICQQMQRGLPVTPYERRLLSQELAGAIMNLDVVRDTYLFFEQMDLVVSGGTVMNRKVAYDAFHKNADEFSQEEWENLMMQRHVREFRILPVSNQSVSAEKQMVYLQTLPLSSISGTKATLVVFLNQASVAERFARMPDLDGDIFVINDAKDVLMSSGGIEPDKELLNQVVTATDLVYFEQEGTTYVADAMQSSQNSGIYYVSLIPEKVMLSRVVKIRNLFEGALLFVLIFGFAIVFYFSRKNVMPIHKMVIFVRRTLGSETGKDTNDVRYITTAVEKIRWRIFSTENDLREQKRVLKDYFLKDLFTGESPADEEVFMRARLYDVYCEPGDYMVILLYVYEHQDFFRDSEILEQSEQERMVHFIFFNVMTELFGEEYHTQMVLLDHFTLACIIHMPEESPTAEERVKGVLEQTHDFIGNNFQMYFTAAVSSRHSFQYLSEAYTEAVAISHQGKPDDGMVALRMDFYQSFPNGERNVVDESFARKLVNYLRGKNIQQAQASLKEFFADCGVYTAEYGDMLKYDLLLIILKALPEKKRDAFMEATTPFAKLTKSKSFPVIERTFCRLLDDAVPFLPDPSRKSSKFCDEIIQYVREEYSNVNLSITMIAEHFEMNAHYISLRFREETGGSLKNFISLVRIEEAKQILVTTSNKLDIIAEAVGFVDNNAFIRIFKKLEGITPGKYREIARTGAASHKDGKNSEFTD